MPERFLLQVLRNLVTHGVLQSSRGVEGGYFLGRYSAGISLLEIIEAIDGPLVSAMPLSTACLRVVRPASKKRCLASPRPLASNSLRRASRICSPSQVR